MGAPRRRPPLVTIPSCLFHILSTTTPVRATLVVLTVLAELAVLASLAMLAVLAAIILHSHSTLSSLNIVKDRKTERQKDRKPEKPKDRKTESRKDKKTKRQ